MSMKLSTIKADSVAFGTNIMEVEVPDHLRHRVKTGVDYFDDSLGGSGLTPSAVYLFTGEAGSGKSTMMQLVCDGLTRGGHEAVYVSGEESPFQLKMTAERLRLKNGFRIAQETRVPNLLEGIDEMRKAAEARGKRLVLVLDSLQTLNDVHPKYGEDYVNSKTPIRALQLITDYCKEKHITAIVIGQVNKDGKFAGNNQLKHMVDGHLHLSVERKDKDLEGCRVLEVTKNRFGGAGSIHFLNLKERGFEVVAKMSAVS
jgi:DNA repair protein RadA/Sms